MIAHRLKTVRHADQIFVIDNGGIAQKGTHEELIAQTGILYSLFEQCIIHLLSPFELLFFRFSARQACLRQSQALIWTGFLYRYPFS